MFRAGPLLQMPWLRQGSSEQVRSGQLDVSKVPTVMAPRFYREREREREREKRGREGIIIELQSKCCTYLPIGLVG